MNQLWHYCGTDGEARGPLPIEVIRDAVSAGQLPSDVQIATSSTGPWAELRIVGELGNAAFLHADAPATEQPPLAAQTSSACTAGSRSVGGLVEMVGYVFCGGGLLCLAALAVSLVNGSAMDGSLVAGALGSIISGALFLALAEILKRLAVICRAMQQQDR